ncbi:MAG: DUF2182 domain-containing protein [Nitriliruptorales bacterium]|nr:DUF2182 domain-containing protein [Nitriliruptorales bacterium]
MTTGRPTSIPQPERSVSTLSLFPRGVTLVVVGSLLSLATVAWVLSVRQAASMADMVSGLAHIGTRMPSGTTIPVFLGMWLAMMVAMMLPTVAPMVLAHRMVAKRRAEGEFPTVAFVLGYLAVWSAIGVVPLLACLGFRSLSAGAAGSRWLPTLAGGILAVAGLHQFSRWKTLCLRTCRSPIGFVLSHDFGGGASSALRAGVSHGAYCLGCCWALMAVLVVVGLMNLVWMAGLALVFLAEKNWEHGVGLTRLVGTGFVILGMAVIVRPDLLRAVAGA